MFVSSTRSLVTGSVSVLLALASIVASTNAAEREFSLIESAKPRTNCCGKAAAENTVTLNYPDAANYKLTATYYSTRGGIKTTLMLNNKAPGPVFAVPTIYSLAGTRLSLTPISVPGASYIDVDMNDLLAGAADEFREGSMKISYDGISQQLGAQVKMVDEANGLIWAEQFVYASKFVSSRLENLWWLPFPNSETKVVVSNTSNGTVTATLTVDGTSPHQAQPLQISLAPWETRVLDILQDIAGRQNGHVHDEGGVSITHSGAPGAVLARMFIAKPNKGYSAATNFIDPEATGSQRWHGNGLRLRNLNGQKVDPVIAVRNVGNQSSNVTGRIIYTRPDGEVAEIAMPPRTINAGKTKSFELKSLINSANVPNSVTYGGIEIKYDTPQGSIITSVQSLSSNGEHVFQVPMFDPTKMPSSAGGFPWKIDGDFSTLIYIKNETDVERKFTIHLRHDTGQYSLGIKKLKARETSAIDFRKLRDEQTPDPRGNVIPSDAGTGQIAWSVQGNANKVLSARSEQISIAEGVASTYSCANCCPNTVQNVYVDPTTAVVEVGETATFSASQTERDCNNTVHGPYYSDGVVWDTLTPSIATANEYGELLGVSPGITSIRGSLDYPEWIDMGNWCADQTRNIKRTALSEIQPGVGEIQYKGPNNPSFTTISSTLYVLKDTTVQFKALPNPANGTFVEGRPVWEGSAGATGSGDTKSITFDVASASTTDFKTVVATSGNSSKTIDVIVYDLIGTLTPVEAFTGRSEERLGLREQVNLNFQVSPGITSSIAGGFRWSVGSAQGTITNQSGNTGIAQYEAPFSVTTANFQLHVVDGPSKDVSRTYQRNVVAPSGGSVSRNTARGMIHCNGTSSSGFYGIIYIHPKDVSFSRIYFTEGGGKITADGFYISENDKDHVAWGFGFAPANCNPTTGCSPYDQDKIYTGKWNPPFGNGSLSLPVEWQYSQTESVSTVANFANALHEASALANGTATIRKQGSGNFIRVPNDPTSEEGCAY